MPMYIGYHGGNAQAYVCNAVQRERLADATTIHYYAESFGALRDISTGGLPASNASWFMSYYVGDRCRMARNCGRPCVIQEVRQGVYTYTQTLTTLHTRMPINPPQRWVPTCAL